MKWNIYHRDATYAESQGDPILAEVEADSLSAALEQAETLKLEAPTGVWAVVAQWAFLRAAK